MSKNWAWSSKAFFFLLNGKVTEKIKHHWTFFKKTKCPQTFDSVYIYRGQLLLLINIIMMYVWHVAHILHTYINVYILKKGLQLDCTVQKYVHVQPSHRIVSVCLLRLLFLAFWKSYLHYTWETLQIPKCTGHSARTCHRCKNKMHIMIEKHFGTNPYEKSLQCLQESTFLKNQITGGKNRSKWWRRVYGEAIIEK